MRQRARASTAVIASRLITVLLFIFLRCTDLPADGGAVLLRPPDAGALRALDHLRSLSVEPLDAAWDPVTGRLRSVEGRFPLEAGADLPAACLALLDREPFLFGLSPGLELRLISRHAGIGSEHLRFRAFISGVPVAGNEAAFHLDRSSPRGPAIVGVSSRLHPHLGTLIEAWRDRGPIPALSAGEAVVIAEEFVRSRALRRESEVSLEVVPLPPPARLAYAVRVYSADPRALHLVRIDAHLGEMISSGDLLQYGPPEPKDGTGSVFVSNPIVALRDATLRDQDDSADAVPPAAYTRVTLRELDGSGGLSGPYVTTERTPDAVRRVRLDFSFLRDDDAFEEVMVYHHIDSAQRFIQSLGFPGIYNLPIPVYVNSEFPGIPYEDLQAYYQPSTVIPGTGVIAFGSGGADMAEDPEVIIHEYGHALQDNQVPGFGQTFDSIETFAIGEGWSDFLAGAYLSAFSGGYGDLCLAEWAAVGLPPLPGGEPYPCFRRLDSTKHYPEDLSGEPHGDGEMWSASLWKIFESLGREEALRLVLQSNFFLGVNARFEDAARAVLRADDQIFGGSHQDLIRGIFLDRGFLQPPLNLTWFYLTRHTPAVRVPALGAAVTSKLRLDRQGVIPTSGQSPLEVYVNLAHPSPGAVDIALRSPTGTTVSLNLASTRFLPARPAVYGLTTQPSEPLEILAGEAISGVWSLILTNQSVGDAALSEWGLRFQGFVRGDSNGDGKLDASDAIAILGYLFLRGELSCPRAADVDDGGSLDVTDAIDLLLHVFSGGPPPPEPYPAPGEDVTPDDLSCGG